MMMSSTEDKLKTALDGLEASYHKHVSGNSMTQERVDEMEQIVSGSGYTRNELIEAWCKRTDEAGHQHKKDCTSA